MDKYKVGQVIKINKRLVSKYNTEIGTYSLICMIYQQTKEADGSYYKLYQLDNGNTHYYRLDDPEDLTIISIEIINDTA